MATRPYKTTGCFRFVFFILIFAPLAYIGASYYNGEDGLGNIKKLANKIVSVFSGVKSTASSAETKSTNQNTTISNPTSTAVIQDLKSSIERKDREINTLINENLELKMKLKECEAKPK